MTTRERLTSLVQQLPDDVLQLALERLEPLATAPIQPREEKADNIEVREFVIHDVPARKVRLPIRIRYHGPRERVTMKIGNESPGFAAAIQSLASNARWWREHRAEVVSKYHNTHIAISHGEVFRGESYFGALSSAQMRHPGDMPLVIRLFNSSPVTTDAN